jgi:hypothetical protein
MPNDCAPKRRRSTRRPGANQRDPADGGEDRPTSEVPGALRQCQKLGSGHRRGLQQAVTGLRISRDQALITPVRPPALLRQLQHTPLILAQRPHQPAQLRQCVVGFVALLVALCETGAALCDLLAVLLPVHGLG